MDSSEDEVNVYLKVIKTVAFKVKRSETTKKLKALFLENEGTPENLQELFFAGELLKDDHRLVDYGIQANSTLHLFLQSIGRIKLLVYIPSKEKTFEVQAKTHETVQNIKLLIQAKEGILPDQHTLFYDGKLLEDNTTLASLGVQSESILYLVFNPRDVVPVSVKMPSGEILKLKVKVLHTVRDVKAIIWSMVGFVASEVNLTYEGKLLEDSKTLACYNIKDNSLLEMLPFPFQILVKDWNGRTLGLKVCKEDRVMDVKDKIKNKQGVPVSHFYLVFSGKRLEDDRDLASYNIEKDAIIESVACYNIEDNSVVEPLPFPIFIKGWNGKTIVLKVFKLDKVRDVKDRIIEKQGATVYPFYLVSAGKRLEDDRDLASYNIEKDSNLCAIFRPKIKGNADQ